MFDSYAEELYSNCGGRRTIPGIRTEAQNLRGDGARTFFSIRAKVGEDRKGLKLLEGTLRTLFLRELEVWSKRNLKKSRTRRVGRF